MNCKQVLFAIKFWLDFMAKNLQYPKTFKFNFFSNDRAPTRNDVFSMVHVVSSKYSFYSNGCCFF